MLSALVTVAAFVVAAPAALAHEVVLLDRDVRELAVWIKSVFRVQQAHIFAMLYVKPFPPLTDFCENQKTFVETASLITTVPNNLADEDRELGGEELEPSTDGLPLFFSFCTRWSHEFLLDMAA